MNRESSVRSRRPWVLLHGAPNRPMYLNLCLCTTTWTPRTSARASSYAAFQSRFGILGEDLEAKNHIKRTAFTMLYTRPEESPRAPRGAPRNPRGPRSRPGPVRSRREAPAPRGSQEPDRAPQEIPGSRSGGSLQGKVRQTAGTPPTILWTKLVQTCGPVLRRPCANFYILD